ncbi:MAG TPA: epimerase, partial [Terriglobia bacterium]|nr:epimerase [Terriglobia bacterium]
MTRALGLAVHDVILTREEIAGLMANLLVSHQPPLGTTQLARWLEQNADRVGRRYASELDRHYR